MTQLGTETNPLRVAIIGAGPAGFYAAEHLLKQNDVAVQVDMFDRLPTPFGLVRGGVAPDHQKIKSVTKVYDKTASDPNFRFYGYVELGRDVSLDDLRRFYHQIIFTTGAQTDKKLGVPGEDFPGNHPATEFVAWYNGHPDYRDLQFDLTQEKAAVIGVGNVAVDVARILSRTADELAKTDIADYALEALSQSKVKEVYLIGRRGPAQAAFTTPEIKELGEMEDADCIVLPEEAELDPLSKAALEQSTDRSLLKKVELMQEYSRRGRTSKKRVLVIRFLLSPVEILGSMEEGVKGMKLVKNELYSTEAGTLLSRPTDQIETLECGLVFRSIGYRGVPLPGVPFHEKWGTIPNINGRVVKSQDSQEQVIGLYTAGWIKRGPSGVIGTNKPDAVETVNMMLEDMKNGITIGPEQPDRDAAAAFIKAKQPRCISYNDWLTLDEIELKKGEAIGRPRLKFTKIEDMLAAVKK
ncbi:MAG: FAD-dependent oxidoreductase [Anaerolineae bacterium]|nr:FAD-dependent oxidoreductase [Anaerolineae bacterium]